MRAHFGFESQAGMRHDSYQRPQKPGNLDMSSGSSVLPWNAEAHLFSAGKVELRHWLDITQIWDHGV